MSIYELIKRRVSVRSYKTGGVPRETIEKVLSAAGLAPSWGNKQCWRFVIVDSKVKKNLIGKASGQANIAKACEDAPYVIVLCAETNESGVKNGMDYYLFDCGLAMENLILTAHEEGLATCVVGWFDEKAIKGVLNLPDGVRVVAFTPLGIGNESIAPRSRKKPEEIIFYNYWGNI